MHGFLPAQLWELETRVCVSLPPLASVTLNRSSFVTGILPPCSASRALGRDWPSLTTSLGDDGSWLAIGPWAAHTD